MAASRLVDVLGEVFRTYGFDTTQPASPEGMGRTQYEVDLLAEKSGMDVLVTVATEPDPIGMDAVDRHARMVHDVGSYYGLIVAPHGFTDAAHHQAMRTRMILWGRSEVEAAIGRAVLHEVLGATEDLAIGDVLGITTRATPERPASEAHLLAPPPSPVAPAAAPEGASGHAAPDPMGFLFGALDDAPDTGGAPADARAAAELRSDPPMAPGQTTTRPDQLSWLPPFADEARRDDDPFVTAHTSATPEPADDVGGAPTTEHGRGWILQSGRAAPPVAPDRPTGLASLAALGGLRRHGRSLGPDPRVFNPQEGVLVAPVVSKEAAAKRARDEIFTIDHTYLRYHPKRVLDWTVDAFVEGRVATTTFRGCRIIDLATRGVVSMTEWTAPRSLREGTFDVAVDHKPVRIEAEKARALALESILEETARQVTVHDHDRALDIMITEKRRVRAHRDDVKIEDRGLHWCPVWCFVGVNGEIEVDGLTGEVLDKRLETPSGSTILI